MDWPRPQILRKDGVLNSYYPPPPPPPPPPSAAKISPAVLFIIVILAVLFFISGLLHLLVRFLTKHPNSSSSAGDGHQEDISTSEALQRQLQQLFNLHDSGLDQAFIDALPVFSYAEIVGPKEPFDCAVCLCEFSDKDKLRLLPTCSHAFHLNCIDTWLLSNSTCPLCRATLFAPGAPLDNPIFEYDEFPFEEDEETGKGVLSVRLGKFKRSDGGSDAPDVAVEASNSSLDARRCYSMGSYQYVVGNTNLRVALCPPDRRPEIKKVANGSNSPAGAELEGKRISSVCKGDSYSVSKIWLWQKKGGLPSSSGDSRIDLPSLGNDFSWTGTSSNA